MIISNYFCTFAAVNKKHYDYDGNSVTCGIVP